MSQPFSNQPQQFLCAHPLSTHPRKFSMLSLLREDLNAQGLSCMAQVRSHGDLQGKLPGQKLQKPQSHLKSSGNKDNHAAKDKGTARALSSCEQRTRPCRDVRKKKQPKLKRSIAESKSPSPQSQEDVATSCLFYPFPAAFCLQYQRCALGLKLARLPSKTQTIKTYMLNKQDLQSSP